MGRLVSAGRPIGSNGHRARFALRRHDFGVEHPIEHGDVTTVMALLGDIQHDVRVIRILLQEDDGEEEEGSETDA